MNIVKILILLLVLVSPAWAQVQTPTKPSGSSLPAGAATEAKQDTGNTSLNSIDTKLTNPLPVSLATVPSHNVTNIGTFAVQAAQSSTWTVQPGNTANSTPWLMTINQGGNSATVTGANALKVDGSAVTQPVSIAATVTVSDGAGAMNTIIDSGTVTSLTQMNGQAIAMGTGVRTAGTQRVTIATDDVVPASQSGTWNIGTVTAITAISNALPAGNANIGDVDIVTMPNVTVGTFPDNEPFNIAQINGVTPLMGNGASGTGAMRVTIANDSTGVLASIGSITNALPSGTNAIGKLAANSGVDIGDVDITSEIPGTGATNLGKAEDAAANSGDTGVAVFWQRKDTNSTLTSADAEYVVPAADNYGAVFVRSDHPNRIRCTVVVSTATALTAVGGSCAAPGAGLSIYITHIHFSTSAAAGTAADSFPTLKYGTGGSCGTGTTIFWGALTVANSTVVDDFTTPIKIPANNEVCWMMSTAGSKFIVLTGYIAP